MIRVTNMDIKELTNQESEMTFANLPWGKNNDAITRKMIQEVKRNTKSGGVMWFMIDTKKVEILKKALNGHKIIKEEDF